MTTTYTIITTESELEIEAERFRRDMEGDLYLYDDEADDPVAHVEAERFVGIFETDRGITRIP